MKISKLKLIHDINNMPIDATLSKYDGKVIFPEKFEKAVAFSKVWIAKNGN